MSQHDVKRGSSASDHHKKREKNTNNNNKKNVDKSSLIEILQSFGIIVKTRINFHDRKKRENLDQQLLEQFMNSRNYAPVVSDGSNDHEGLMEQSIQEGKVMPNGHDHVVNIKRSKIIIRFKCGFDHTKSFDLEKNDCNSLDEVKNNFNMGNERMKKETFYSIIGAERKNTNVMHIEFDLKFDSILEIVKYLNISDCKNVNLMLENEILSRLVDILDVDQEKKQVYIKLKTFDTTSSTTNLVHYFLMGKLDGTETCFMLDVTYINCYARNLTTIDQIYQYYTPGFLRSRIYSKNNSNTFQDCKDVGIYRVLIGCFFYGMTTSSGGVHMKSSRVHPFDIIYSKFKPKILECPYQGGGYGLIVQNIAEFHRYHGAYSRDSYGGIIDTGFYKFELKSLCKLYNSRPLSFTREFYHFSL